MTNCPECNCAVEYGEENQWVHCEGCGEDYHVNCAPIGWDDALCEECAAEVIA